MSTYLMAFTVDDFVSIQGNTKQGTLVSNYQELVMFYLQ